MVLATVVRDDESAPFFDAAAEGRLLLRYSPTSHEWSEPSAQFCSVTQASDLEWRESSGYGTVISWTWKPGRRREDVVTPGVLIGIVQLEEGPWMSMWFPDAEPSDIKVSASVKVEFFTPESGEPQPIARLI